ncbi:hypothetical protein SDJN03_15586, partial [Cucurbita argyrosperma subsp. sororia]
MPLEVQIGSPNQTDEICLGISVSVDFCRPASMEEPIRQHRCWCRREPPNIQIPIYNRKRNYEKITCRKPQNRRREPCRR